MIDLENRCLEATLERLEAAKDVDELWRSVKVFCDQYGFNQATYNAANIPSLGVFSIDLSTVTEDFRHYYVENRFYEVDPVIVSGASLLVAFDWDELGEGTPIARRIRAEGREAGIGRNAISAPIHGAVGGSALFSVSSDICDREWAQLRCRNRRDVQTVGLHLHERFLALGGGAHDPMAQSLSPREGECLKWAAAGKTIKDTATILSLSERAVRGYLDSARRKLDCLTKTQAVVRAMLLGIIRL